MHVLFLRPGPSRIGICSARRATRRTNPRKIFRGALFSGGACFRGGACSSVWEPATNKFFHIIHIEEGGGTVEVVDSGQKVVNSQQRRIRIQRSELL